jgi:hypothetical protein
MLPDKDEKNAEAQSAALLPLLAGIPTSPGRFQREVT